MSSLSQTYRFDLLTHHSGLQRMALLSPAPVSTISTSSIEQLTAVQTLVIFDSRLEQLDTLYGALLSGTVGYSIEPSQDSLSAVTELLTKTGARRLAIVAHGDPGVVYLGAKPITLAELNRNAGLLQEWGIEEISLYSCEVGADAEFVARLGELTGARVAAATGKVGAAAMGGDWALDVQYGDRAVSLPLSVTALASYVGILSTFNTTSTSGNDAANAASGTLTGFTGGTVADLQDATGDTFNPGKGTDIIIAGAGDDTIKLNLGGISAGDSFDGGAGSDTIALTGVFHDFSLATIVSIENITTTDNLNTHVVTLTATQFAGFTAIDLGTSGVLTINVNGSVDFSTGIPTLSNISAISIAGDTAADTITLTGAQLDALLSATNNSIDLQGGTNTINLTSTSTNFNSATDEQIANVQNVTASGATGSVTIDLSSQTEGFNITGSGFADTITGSAGVDSITGGAGNDTIKGFTTGDTVIGGADTDTIALTATSTALNSASDTQIDGVENISAAGATAGVTINLSSQTEGFSITGTSYADSITGGAGNDTINKYTAGDTVTGGAGTDTLSLIKGFGNNVTDAQLNEIEVVVAGASTGYINLSNQTESFTIVGRSTNGTDISGGAGNDTITGGSSYDTITGGAGNDTIVLNVGDFGSGDSLNGGLDTDTLQLNGAGTYNLSNVTITNIENLSTTGAGNQVVTLTAAQFAGFTAIDLGGGTGDELTIIINGLVDLSAGIPTITGVETIKLVGTTSNDVVTFTGAELNALLATATSSIDLDAGIDAIYITSTSTSLNSAADIQIVGVENIVALGATAAVTINLSSQTEGFTIVGSSYDDTIIGSAGADSIYGENGNDTINEFTTGDTVFGGAGNDTIVLGTTTTLAPANDGQITGVEYVSAAGATGAVTINLISQNEGFTITGSAYADSILGSHGSDNFIGFVGKDTIDGGTAQPDTATDTLIIAATSADLNSAANGQILNIDVVSAASATAAVTINLSSQSDGFIITGSGYDDTITGSSGIDTINAGDGNDTIKEFTSGDTVNGGSGTDTLSLTTTTNLNTATDAQIDSVENISAAGATVGVTMNLSTQTEGFNITGSGYADSITGGQGNDTIQGFVGQDTVNGGLGYDTIVLTATSDALNLAVNSQISGVEAVSAASTTDGVEINLSSQQEGFAITGGAGNDIIHGGDGADIINADNGDDTILGFNGTDNVNGGSGTDTISIAGLSTSSINVAADSAINSIENVTLTSPGTLNLANQQEGFTITSSAGVDTITGGQGNDTFVGFVGADSINGAGGTDTIVLTATSNDLNTAGDSNIQLVEAVSAAGATVAVTINLSNQTEGFTITGSAQADSITGGAGNDTIKGFTTGDTVVGGAGTDTIAITATSTGLNTATDAQIVGVEIVTAAGATAASISASGLTNPYPGIWFNGLAADGVTINLSSQTEGFTIVGSGYGDVIVGTGYADVINSGNGHDIIKGFAGQDTVDGGDGTDYIALTATSATLNAATNDQIKNVEGVFATDATAAVEINLSSQTENSYIYGSGYDDTLTGGSGNNYIYGNDGNDTIQGFVGTDTVNGGVGNDTIALTTTSTYLNSATDANIVNVELVSAAGATVGVTINLSSQTEGFTITGSGYDDTITGSTVADTINAGAGNDTIKGFTTGDTVDGGAGTNDTIAITATSAALNTATDAQLVNVEAVSAANADSATTNTPLGNLTGIIDSGTHSTYPSYTDPFNLNTVSFGATGVTIDLHNQTTDASGFTITGSSYGDIITGSGYGDTINTGYGNDVIQGFVGKDTVNGGDSGYDLNVINLTATSADLNSATDDQIANIQIVSAATAAAGVEINLSSQTDSFAYAYGEDGPAPVGIAILGSGYNDTITGSNSFDGDSIFAGAGNDIINGFFGADTVDGGAGDDTLVLTETSIDLNGSVLISPATDAQIINIESVSAASATTGVEIDLAVQSEGFSFTGSSYADTIRGGAGNNTFNGFVGNDSLVGGAGNDTIVLTATSTDLNQAADDNILNIENVSAAGATAAVTINLSSQSDGFTITGSGYDDTITGSSNADIINAGAGNDTIKEFAGADVVDGGTGTDTISLTATSSNLNSATDEQIIGVENVSAAGATVAVTINLSSQTDGFTVTGSGYDDIITGSSVADKINAGAGNDTIKEFVGADVVDGGDGNDTIALTATSFDLNSATDEQIISVENISAAGATVAVTINLSSQSDGFTITGSGYDDTITGSTVADTINAGAGNDTTNEFVGADTVNGGDGYDRINLSATSTDLNQAADDQIVNVQEVSAYDANAAVTINLSSQTEGFYIEGSDYNDTITGGQGNNVISAGDGDDVINGFNNGIFNGDNNGNLFGGFNNGNPFDGSNNGDRVDGGAGYDTLNVTEDLHPATTFSIVNVEKVSAAGAIDGVAIDLSQQTSPILPNIPFLPIFGGFTIIGSEHNDTITGSAFADRIDAKAGDDKIVGFTDTDIVDGGSGSDTIELIDQPFNLGGNPVPIPTYDLNRATDAQIVNIETISAAGIYNRPVNIDLSNQTDGFTIVGSGYGESIIIGTGYGDTIIGSQGNDTIQGADGKAKIDGQAGFDTISVADGQTTNLNALSDTQIVNVEAISAADGFQKVNINLSSQTEGFTIVGTNIASDTIWDDDFPITTPTGDTITGSQGNDIIQGFVGTDIVDGGSGTDTIVLTETSTYLNTATDEQIVSIEAVSAANAAQAVEINLSSQAEGFTITGSGYGDIITGSGYGDIINAGAGNDTINEFVGADNVDGGSGTDTIVLTATSNNLNTAADNQIVSVESISVAVVTAAVTINLSSQTDGFTITGSDYADTITGSGGADTINAGDGDDTINGFVGADTVDGGSGFNSLNLTANSISSLNLASDAQITNIQEISAMGIAAAVSIDLSNQSDGFVILGSESGDIIRGSSGNDTVIGGTGNDKVIFTGNRTDYTITRDEDGDLIVTDNRPGVHDGTDVITGDVENLTFANGTFTTGTSGTLDITAPTITSIAYGTNDGSLQANEIVQLTVTFDEAVNVNTTNGSPTLTLNSGGTANYLSGTGTNTLTFRYTVGATDNTADLAITGFSANGAIVKDAQGNIANLAGTTFNPTGILVVDTLAPTAGTLALTSFDDSGTSAVDRITNDKAFGLSLTGAEAGATVVYQSSTTNNVWVDTTPAQADLADANYQFRAKITDAASNTSYSNVINVTVDTTADRDNNLSFVGVNGAGTSTAQNMPFEIQGNDFGNTLPVVTITDADGNSVDAQFNSATSKWSANVSNFDDGTLTISATTSDVAGNNANITKTFTLDTVAPFAPTIGSISDDTGITTNAATSSDKRTSDDTPILNGTAEAGSTVNIYRGATVATATTLVGTATAGTDGIWSFQSAALAQGNYTFRARALDAVGNISPRSTVFNVSIDTTAPGATTISSFSQDTGSSPTDGITKDNTLTLSGNVPTDAVELEIFNGATSLGKAAISGTTWTLTTATLTDGTYNLTANVRDLAGNTSVVSTNTLNVKIDTTAPTAIGFDSTSINENNAANAVVANLSTTDTGAGNTSFAYALVTGTGDTDNTAFTIVGNQLKLTAAANAETKASYSIRVRSTDLAGNSFETSQTIAVNDVNEFALSAISDSNSVGNAIDENSVTGTTVGITASARDLDATNNTVTYSLTNNAGGRFAINSTSGVVTVAGTLDYEAAPSRSIDVLASSSDGSTSTQAFTIAINDVNEAPTALSLVTPASLNENVITTAGIKVSDITITDDALGTNTYSLSGADASSFAIRTETAGGKALYFIGASPNFEVKPTYAVTVAAVDTTLTGSTPVSQSFTLNIANINDAPTLTGSKASLAGGTEDIYFFGITKASLLAGFTDEDGNALAIADLTANHGNLVAVGDNWLFLPETDYNGTVNLTYNVVDGNTGSTPATQSFVLAAANDAPIGSPTATLTPGTVNLTYTISEAILLQGFSDPDNDPLSVINLSATNGTLSAKANGQWTFTPTENFNGTVNLTYDVSDGILSRIAQTRSLNVLGVVGTNNDEVVLGTAANDTMYALGGNDALYGGAGNDALYGGDGNDVLYGNDGNNTLDGGAGNDTLFSSMTGVDTLTGGTGDDVYEIHNTNDIINESSGGGNDTIWTAASYTLSANVENMYLVGSINGTGNAGDNTIVGYGAGEHIIDGGAGNDLLVGGTSNDTLLGGAGNDALYGGDGNDILRGQDGNNTLDGGAGNDTLFSSMTGVDTLTGGIGDDVYEIHNTNDIINESFDGGNDTVWTDASYTLSANVENMYLVGNIDGTGNAGDNTIVGYGAGEHIIDGGAGNDFLVGGAGNDTLLGGTGNNLIYGGAGNDTFVFDANSIAQLITGINTIGDFTVNQDKIQLSKLAFTALSTPTGSLADFDSLSGTGDFSIVTSDAAADTAVNAIVYNTSNGKLFYNTDGATAGVGNSNQFAQLATGLDLHGTDFTVVGNYNPLV
jgi:Ca2+-binding RTX toxin-like protein